MKSLYQLKKELKSEFDEILYDLYAKNESYNFSYSDRYKCYFKQEVLTEYKTMMSESGLKAYGAGAGQELEPHVREGSTEMEPPKMLSVASSSRFCYLLFKDFIPESFGEAPSCDNQSVIAYEKTLRVVSGGKAVLGKPPHMDAYFNGDDYELFFECKCHEFFDSHAVTLSKAYESELARFSPSLIDDRYKSPLIGKDGNQITDKKGNPLYEYAISPVEFGIDPLPKNVNLLFDVKQLITHLMGIKSHQVRAKTRDVKRAKLIYLYFIPHEARNAQTHPEIAQLVDELLIQAQTIFHSQPISNYLAANQIELQMYLYQPSMFTTYSMEPASADNLTPIFLSDKH